MTHVYGHNSGDELLLWDVHRLWELARDLPIEQRPLEEFQSVLEARRVRFWSSGREAPSLLEVVTFFQRIEAVDLQYPILLSAEGEVMDGQHRLAKAWMQGASTIRVVRFPVTPDPDERRPLTR
jgi:hypothetical protein